MNQIRNYKKIIALAAFIGLILIILGYSFYRTRDLIRGVVLQVENLENGAQIDTASLKFAGLAKNSTALYLNGREIFVDKNFRFNETLLLLPGYNIIEIKALNRFGGEKTKDYQIIYQSNG